MIYDCRRKETLEIHRVGGDLELVIKDTDGKVLYQGWFQMKKPYRKTYLSIEMLFEILRSKFERQEV